MHGGAAGDQYQYLFDGEDRPDDAIRAFADDVEHAVRAVDNKVFESLVHLGESVGLRN